MYSVEEEGLSWPDNMLELIHYIDNKDSPIVFEKLPKAMTSLTIRSNEEAPILRSSVIHCLPRGLTYLSVAQLDWTDIDSSTWPSTLIDFSIEYGTFSAEHFHLLPRNLKKFLIFKCEDDDDQEEEGEEEEEESKPLPLHRSVEALCTLGRESLSTDTH